MSVYRHTIISNQSGRRNRSRRNRNDSDDVGAEGGPLLLRVKDFVGSVERLARAKARGCPWNASICAYVAWGGQLEVLRWAWERRCPW